jgi:hypothetical protein
VEGVGWEGGGEDEVKGSEVMCGVAGLGWLRGIEELR